MKNWETFLEQPEVDNINAAVHAHQREADQAAGEKAALHDALAAERAITEAEITASELATLRAAKADSQAEAKRRALDEFA